MRTLILACALLVATASTSAHAVGSSGCIKTRLRFFQGQGNYCPVGRDCTGSTYLQSEYNTPQPIRDVRVFLYNPNGDVIIGQGSTDDDGYVTISWTSHLTTVDNARVFITWQQSGNRFKILDINGDQIESYAGSSFNLTEGATCSAPQNLGSFLWGSLGNEHPYANLYNGALRMWESLSDVNLMVTQFTGIKVRAFEPSVNPQCGTSCASGPNKEIRMDANSAFSPQARILHEMGHIASYLSAKDNSYAQWAHSYKYNNGSDNGADSWSMSSPEWSSAGFEEGFATFLGDRAFYLQNAPEPTTCLGEGTCSTSTEASTGSGSCVSGETRRPISVVRFMRDVYDSTSDFTGESSAVQFYSILGVKNAIPNGSDELQKDEPVGWFNTIDDLDGRSANDWRYHATALGHGSLSNQYTANCSPLGDQ